MFYDQPESQYVITTRDFTKSSGRDIAIAKSQAHRFGEWESPTELIESGDNAHQLSLSLSYL